MEGLNDMEKAFIEKKTEELLSNINYENGEIDVISVANSLGLSVGNAVLDDDVDGFIIVDESKKEILNIKTDKLIGVNSSRDLDLKRFIIAHEIAHFVLHYNQKSIKGMYAHRDHRNEKEEKEIDADYFAANLLMPKEPFKSRFHMLKEKNLSLVDISLLLASYFKVPLENVKGRIVDMGLRV